MESKQEEKQTKPVVKTLADLVLELVEKHEKENGVIIERLDVSHFKDNAGAIHPHLVSITQYNS